MCEVGRAEGVSAALGPAVHGSCSGEEIAVFLPALLQSLGSVWDWGCGDIGAVSWRRARPGAGGRSEDGRVQSQQGPGGSEHRGAPVLGTVWNSVRRRMCPQTPGVGHGAPCWRFPKVDGVWGWCGTSGSSPARFV